MTIRAIVCAVCLLVALPTAPPARALVLTAAGWFGDDWSIEKGDFIWNDGRRFP